MNKPTIVCGTGRCGSSIIAGVLHHLGVNMGETYPAPTNNQQAGYFEDVDIGTLCVNRLEGSISKEEWTDKMSTLFERRHTSDFWGWKNPVSIHLLPEILELTGGGNFIWTRRDKQATIKSMRKHWFMTRGKAKRRFERDDDWLQEFFDSKVEDSTVMTIWFVPHMERIEIVKDIINFIGIKPTEKQAQRAVESILLPPAPVIRTTEANLWKYND